MSTQGHHRGPTIRGTIRHRLLVNAVVDPEEAALRLPRGLRPHVVGGATVVGCCLLDLGEVRPAPLPARAGITVRAAAHRISAEWDDEDGATTVGVYVPVRHSDSHPARVVGGRWFPGLHRRARVDLSLRPGCVAWTVEPADASAGLGIEVAATTSEPSSVDAVGETCLGAVIGVSPDHHGGLEAASMEPDHRTARAVVVDHLDSAFLAGFSTARPAASYLMADVGVTWTRTDVATTWDRRTA